MSKMLLSKVTLSFVLIAVALAQEEAFEDAEAHLAEFIRTVQAAIDDSSAKFDQLEQVVAYVASEAIRNAEMDLISISRLFATEVDRIREESTDVDPDSLDQCIAPQAEEMETVPPSTRVLIHECVNEKEDETGTGVRAARSEAQAQLSIADALRADIDSCYVATDSQECISRVIIEILLQTLEAPLNVQELAQRAEDQLMSYIYAIPDCTVHRINNVAYITDTLLRAIRTCIDNINALN